MNRRFLAVIAVLIAVPLFVGPLVSPVPDYELHIEISVKDNPVNFSTEEEKEARLENRTTMRYQNLSTPAQHLFDRADKRGWRAETTVPVDEVPTSWTTLFSNNSDNVVKNVYVQKDGQYYYLNLYRYTPKPSLQAFMLRLGPLLGAIGLGTLAGYFVLTAED